MPRFFGPLEHFSDGGGSDEWLEHTDVRSRVVDARLSSVGEMLENLGLKRKIVCMCVRARRNCVRERKREWVYEKEERVKKSTCVCVYVRKREREMSAATLMGPTHRKNSWRSSLSLSQVEECATRLRMEQLVQRYQTIRPSYATFEIPTCRADFFANRLSLLDIGGKLKGPSLKYDVFVTERPRTY